MNELHHERAYFERGFIAAYAWAATKLPATQISDAVIDHAWEHRDEGMSGDDILPILTQRPPEQAGAVPAGERDPASRACHFGGVAYGHADLAIAQRAACAIVPFYGTGDHGEQEAARKGKLWNDHPAVQGALRALHEARRAAFGAVEAIERFVTDHAGTDDSTDGMEVEERAQKAVAYLRAILSAAPTPPDAGPGEMPAGMVAWNMVNRLRDEEADSVTILCDNPDGPPNNAVECCGFWTGFVDRRFEGDTINDALASAVAAKDHAASVGYPDPAPPQTPPDAGIGSDGAADQSYLVWSNEHRAWWKPGERGYTRKVARAGRYSREAAIKIASTRGGGWPVDGNPYEIAIPERDAIEQASA